MMSERAVEIHRFSGDQECFLYEAGGLRIERRDTVARAAYAKSWVVTHWFEAVSAAAPHPRCQAILTRLRLEGDADSAGGRRWHALLVWSRAHPSFCDAERELFVRAMGEILGVPVAIPAWSPDDMDAAVRSVRREQRC